LACQYQTGRWRSRAGLLFWVVTLLLGTLTLDSCSSLSRPDRESYSLQPQVVSNVPRYDVLEVAFRHNGVYRNNFSDVDLKVVFRSPSGVEHHVSGFYYARDVWKIRFRPDDTGTWTYSYSFNGKGVFHRQGNGTFQCLPGTADGPIRKNPENRFRWIFAGGKPFFPVGLQDCIQLGGERPKDLAIDGEDRSHPGRRVSPDEYFSIYGQAGFNLLRFSQKNCSYSLFDDLDHYRVAESLATDDLLATARNHGFRTMFGFFGFYGKQQSDIRAINVIERAVNDVLGHPVEAIETPENPELVEKEKRFAAYCVARWGVYADFWELLNERHASDQWTTLMADYVRSVDPDRKPISTSWEKADLTAIDINAPHWYESENELSSDLRWSQLAGGWKRFGKPVIVGEQGNAGMNWDPRSAVRTRIRTWTALFQEISLVFWNTSESKAAMFGGHYTPGNGANIYLGPEERGYVRVLQDFASRLDSNIHMAPVSVNPPGAVRAYGLASTNVAGFYLQHATTHDNPAQDAELSFDFSPLGHRQLNGEWIDPATGRVVGRVKVPSSLAKLPAPPFKVDLALLVTAQQ